MSNAEILGEVDPKTKELKIEILGRFDQDAALDFVNFYKNFSPPIKLCTINLIKVVFIDSNGLAALLRIRDELYLDASNIYLSIKGNEYINSILHKVQYHRIFTLIG